MVGEELVLKKFSSYFSLNSSQVKKFPSTKQRKVIWIAIQRIFQNLEEESEANICW